ncbi:MAG: hypothetical protein MUE84_18635, partial [Hyphomonas sp.]|nr:hypothetical protein [Hyphomonas sp.]
MPVRRTESVVQIRALENVQPPVEQDLPAGVRHEVSGVDCAGPVESPAELDPERRDSVSDLFQIARLARARTSNRDFDAVKNAIEMPWSNGQGGRSDQPPEDLQTRHV